MRDVSRRGEHPLFRCHSGRIETDHNSILEAMRCGLLTFSGFFLNNARTGRSTQLPSACGPSLMARTAKPDGVPGQGRIQVSGKNFSSVAVLGLGVTSETAIMTSVEAQIIAVTGIRW